jgi:acetylxylan esterase
MFSSTTLHSIFYVLALPFLSNGALVAVPDFGSNPTGLEMNIYVPTKLANSPAVILAVSNSQINNHVAETHLVVARLQR